MREVRWKSIGAEAVLGDGRLSINASVYQSKPDGSIVAGIEFPIEVLAEILPEEIKDALDFYAREANYDNGDASSEAGARAREALKALDLARIKVVRGPEFNALHFECVCGARWMVPEDDAPAPDETECPNCIGFFKTKIEAPS